jgi:transmembrane protein DUF3566
LPGTVDQASFFEEDGVEHRVEPPSWLPEGAAPEGDGPDPGDSTVSADSSADKGPLGNGQDGTGTFRYSYDSSFTESKDSSTEGDQDASFGDREDQAPANGTQDGGYGGAPESTFGSGQDTAFGSGQDTAYAGGQDSSFGSTYDSGYGAAQARQDDAYGGAAGTSYGQDAAYGSNQNGTTGGAQESVYGSAHDAAFGSYGTAGTGSAADRDQTPEQAWPRHNDPAGTTTYSARMLAEPTSVTDPVSDATGAYGYTPPPPAPVASSGSKSKRPKAAVSTSGSAPSGMQPRRANLVIARLEPWSVMKFSFLISLVAWIVLFVAVGILYYALSGLGVFDALQKTVSSVTSGQGTGGVSLTKWTSASRVLGYTMLIGAVNVVLITALSTVGAMIYNLVTHLGGGIEVTLKETD